MESDTETGDRDWYRCWCEECDWVDVIKGQEASASLINLGHGVPTGHTQTFREKTEPPVRGPECRVCANRANGHVGGKPSCGNVLCRITLRGKAEELRLAIFGSPEEISESCSTGK